MSPFSMALPKMLSCRGEENILGKRVRMSNLILVLPQTLHSDNLHHTSFEIYVLDDLLYRRQKDFSPFTFDDVDVMGSCSKDLLHLSDPFPFLCLNLHPQNIHPII